MWHEGIIAVYLGRDDLGEEFAITERYTYNVYAEYEGGETKRLPGTHENKPLAVKETKRYASLISELNGVECAVKPMSKEDVTAGWTIEHKHKEKFKRYIQEQKRQKYVKKMINTGSEKRTYY